MYGCRTLVLAINSSSRDAVNEKRSVQRVMSWWMHGHQTRSICGLEGTNLVELTLLNFRLLHFVSDELLEFSLFLNGELGEVDGL